MFKVVSILLVSFVSFVSFVSIASVASLSSGRIRALSGRPAASVGPLTNVVSSFSTLRELVEIGIVAMIVGEVVVATAPNPDPVPDPDPDPDIESVVFRTIFMVV